jgi:hypothetical protein
VRRGAPAPRPGRRRQGQEAEEARRLRTRERLGPRTPDRERQRQLTAAGKKLLEKRRSVRVVAQATTGGQVTTTPVTLRRAAKGKKK